MSDTKRNPVERTEPMDQCDEVKRDKVSHTKKESVLETIENITLEIVDDPSLWIKPEFGALRRFVHKVSSHPLVFLPGINPLTSSTILAIHSSTLSKGLIQGIYNRECLSRNNP